MTLIEMARQAGFVTGLRDYADGNGSMPYVQSLATSTFLPELERFAALVAEKATEQANARQNASWALMCKKMVAAERELCAQVCEAEGQSPYATKHAAANIRARGQK
jgi:hypothetical protein